MSFSGLPTSTTLDASSLAGKYFETRTHYLASFSVEKGNLMLEGHILQHIESNRFKDPIIGGTVEFSGSNGVMNATVTYNNAVTFAGTRIDDLDLDDAAIAAYAGEYKSAELDATCQLTFESGKLMLTVGWNPPIELAPFIKDEFAGGEMTIVFRRDNAGHISGLSIFAGWGGTVRNENFERLN